MISCFFFPSYNIELGQQAQQHQHVFLSAALFTYYKWQVTNAYYPIASPNS